MVKSFKKSFHKLIRRTHSNSDSPVLQINSEALVENENIFQSEEDLYTNVNHYLYGRNGLKTSNSISSTSSSNTCNENEIKLLRKEKKMKSRLSEVGNKHIAELIAYLHSNRDLVKTKFHINSEELDLLESHDSAVDLDKYFIEKKSK